MTTLPPLPRRQAEISEALNGQHIVWWCGHSGTDDDVWICGFCPSTGLRCHDCATEHLQIGLAHDLDAFPCDSCGGRTGAAAKLLPDVMWVDECLLRLQSPNGLYAEVEGGRIQIMPAVKLCSDCAAQFVPA